MITDAECHVQNHIILPYMYVSRYVCIGRGNGSDCAGWDGGAPSGDSGGAHARRLEAGRGPRHVGQGCLSSRELLFDLVTFLMGQYGTVPTRYRTSMRIMVGFFHSSSPY